MQFSKPRPQTLTQTHGPTNPSTTPMRPLDQPRTIVQCRIQTQFSTTMCAKPVSAKEQCYPPWTHNET